MFGSFRTPSRYKVNSGHTFVWYLNHSENLSGVLVDTSGLLACRLVFSNPFSISFKGGYISFILNVESSIPVNQTMICTLSVLF